VDGPPKRPTDDHVGHRRHTISREEMRRRMSPSRFRLTKEPAMDNLPKLPAQNRMSYVLPGPRQRPISREEMKRRMSTSRFRVMSEEPAADRAPARPARDRMDELITVGRGRHIMSRAEWNRRMSTSRFRVMSEVPQLSLLQRTAKFLSSHIGRSKKTTLPRTYRLLDKSRIYAAGVNLSLISTTAPPSFPPLQFTPANIPGAFSLRILGLKFMTQ
jgi:hypothetical protein